MHVSEVVVQWLSFLCILRSPLRLGFFIVMEELKNKMLVLPDAGRLHGAVLRDDGKLLMVVHLGFQSNASLGKRMGWP